MILSKIKNDHPLVSIIIANYNKGEYLDECFESILKQTYKNLEIIIADDCSTDNSLNIIEGYCKKHLNFILIKNANRVGVAQNRHSAILASEGKYIMTLDSDDFLIEKEKITQEMNLIQNHSIKSDKEILAFSNILHIGNDGLVQKKVGNNKNIKQGNIFSDIITRNCMIPRDFLMAKNQYFSAGGYDNQIPLYEDWDLKIRLASKYEYYFCDIDGIGYRRHGKGLSAAPLKDHIHWLSAIFCKNFHLTPLEKKIKVANKFNNFLNKLEKTQ